MILRMLHISFFGCENDSVSNCFEMDKERTSKNSKRDQHTDNYQDDQTRTTEPKQQQKRCQDVVPQNALAVVGYVSIQKSVPILPKAYLYGWTNSVQPRSLVVVAWCRECCTRELFGIQTIGTTLWIVLSLGECTFQCFGTDCVAKARDVGQCCGTRTI